MYIPGQRLIVECSLLTSADPNMVTLWKIDFCIKHSGMADKHYADLLAAGVVRSRHGRRFIIAHLKSDNPGINTHASLNTGTAALRKVDCCIFY